MLSNRFESLIDEIVGGEIVQPARALGLEFWFPTPRMRVGGDIVETVIIKYGEVEYGLEAVFNNYEESFVEIRRADTKERFEYFDFFVYAVDVMGFSWDAIKDVEHEFKLSQLSPEERVKAEAAEKRLARMTRAFAREKDENRVPPVPLEPEAYRAMFAEEVPSEKTIRQMNWWGWLHDIGEGKTEATFEEWLAGNGRGGAGAGKEGVEKGTEGKGDGGSPGEPPHASGDSTKR